MQLQTSSAAAKQTAAKQEQQLAAASAAAASAAAAKVAAVTSESPPGMLKIAHLAWCEESISHLLLVQLYTNFLRKHIQNDFEAWNVLDRKESLNSKRNRKPKECVSRIYEDKSATEPTWSSLPAPTTTNEQLHEITDTFEDSLERSHLTIVGTVETALRDHEERLNSAMVLNSVFVALLTPVIAYAVMRCLPWLFNLHSLVKHNPIRSGLMVCCILLATVNIPTVKIALSFSSIFITKYFIKWYVFASFFGRRNTHYGFNSILHNNHEVTFLTGQFRVA